MDSKCVNILNNLSSNFCKLDNRLRKINNRIKKIQKEVNIIDNLFLEQIAFVWATEDFAFETDKVKKSLGEDIFNTCAFEVDTFIDIKNKVQELIDEGRKYIIVTNTASVSSIIDLIYEYKDILFISINSTDTKFSNISNLKKMLPDNSFMAKTIIEAVSQDYNIFITESNKMKVVGLYDSDGLFSTDLFNKINIENSKLLNIEIKWFDTFKYLSGNEIQKKEWLIEWNQYFNNLNFTFDFIYISTDSTFINDKITIYPLSEYLFKCYFSDTILGLKLNNYRTQPFGSLISKSFFTFIKSEFINLYLLLVDSITSIRCKDFFQIENLYYTKLINFNQNLNNIDNYNLFFSKEIFSTFTTINQDEQNYINLINFLTEVNYKRLIRSNIELQLIIVSSVINEINYYETLTTNEKSNYNVKFEIPYNDEILIFFFFGNNTIPNNTIFVQDISKNNINNITLFNINQLNTKSLNIKSLNVKSLNEQSDNNDINGTTKNTEPTGNIEQIGDIGTSGDTEPIVDNQLDINILTSYNNYFTSNINFISGIVQVDSNCYSFYKATMFNTAFSKSLFYINNTFNLQNASSRFIDFIGSNNQETKTNEIYNRLNRTLQNILIFYKWSTVNISSNIWTLMYLNQSQVLIRSTRNSPEFRNRTNFRILLKLNSGTNQTLIGFQNKLGGESQNDYIDDRFIDLTSNTNFYNTSTSQNSQFNNIFLTSDYFKFDSSTNKWIPNTNNKDNQINMLLDLVKIYLTSFNIDTIKEIIKKDCFLSAIMITFSQRYLVEDSYFANLPNPSSEDFNLTNNPDWKKVNDNNIFKDQDVTAPVYSFMIQFTNGFKLWNEQNTQDLSSLNIPKTEIISGNITNDSPYCTQYTYQENSGSMNSYYLGTDNNNNNINNVNSINVDIFRKINPITSTSKFNNCLFYFDEQIPSSSDKLDEPWTESSTIFINGLTK
jgi:hypothetical protein